MSAVGSSGSTRRSASGSSSSKGSGSVGRPKGLQNHPYSTAARGLTRASQVGADGASGRARSSSPTPSSFHRIASRWRSRATRRLSFSPPVNGTRRGIGVLQSIRLGMVRIATWNVNSVKQRVPRLLPWLDERQPHVVCLQETKLTDEAFAALLDQDLA